MIRQVRGTVIAVDSNFLIIEVGNAGAGIGLRVFTPEPTSARFRAGDNLSLYTHLQVRENELSLYGFEELDELVIFEALLGVSGVGPKVALATLSTLTPDALRLAVANEEPGYFGARVGHRQTHGREGRCRTQGQTGSGGGRTGGARHGARCRCRSDGGAHGTGVQRGRSAAGTPADTRRRDGVEDRLRMALIQFGE